MNKYQMFIDSKWIDAVSGATFDDLNPYTGKVYAQVPKGDAKDADRAMVAAYAARKPWSSTPPLERSQILCKAAQILEERRKEFADVLIAEGGSVFSKAMFEISRTVDILQTAGADCKRILGETFHTNPDKLSMTLRKPKGTVVVISLWNFPLILSMYKIAYSLATGNTVVFKPASETPVIGLKIGELFERAGLLAGVLNVVTGSRSMLGNALIDDDRCSYVTITGETPELGRKNPLIILSDANIDYAVNAAAFGVFLHQGQICTSVGRIIVEQNIVEEFAGKLAEKAAFLPIGNPSLPETVIGPLINDEQVGKVDALVKDAVAQGAKLLTGGKYEGRLYQPTVLIGVTSDMRIFKEETFGPVASIISVRDEKEALQVANDTQYGLSAGVITPNLEKAIYLTEGLEARMVHVNDTSIDVETSIPIDGCKDSGLSREGGYYSIEELTEVKWVTIQKQKRVFPF